MFGGGLQNALTCLLIICGCTCLGPSLALASGIPCQNPTLQMPANWENKGKVRAASRPDVQSLLAIPKDLIVNRENIYLENLTHAALLKMIAAAEKEGIYLQITSGFRSESAQQKIIDSKLKNGMCPSDIFKVVAPTGYSTHATGRAVDFFPANKAFANSGGYRWLKKNAEKYGFTETFSEDNSFKVDWEPWHYDFTFR